MILPRLGERFLNLPKTPDLSVDRPEQNFRQKINEFHGNVNGSFFRTHCLTFLFFFLVDGHRRVIADGNRTRFESGTSSLSSLFDPAARYV